MNGTSHAGTSALLVAATWPILPAAVAPASTPGEIVQMFTAVGLCAPGAGLMPDGDHPSSTIARTGSFVTRPIARIVHHLTGHRGAWHSLVMASLGGVATWGVMQLPHGTAIAATTVVGITLDLRKPGTNLAAAILRFALAFLTVWALTSLGVTWEWLPWTVAIGWAAGAIGDGLTHTGAELLWPFYRAPVWLLPADLRFSTRTARDGGPGGAERLVARLQIIGLVALVLHDLGQLGYAAHVVHVLWDATVVPGWQALLRSVESSR